MRKVFFLIILSVSISSCKKDCWQSAGEDAIEDRQLEEFSSIDINDNFIVHLIQDSLSFIELRGKSNLISHIETKVEGQTLNISDQNTCSLLKGYHKNHLYIHFTELENLNIWGSIELYSNDTIRVDNINFMVKGDVQTWALLINAQNIHIEMHAVVGNIKISGSTQDIYLYTSGTNFCYFKNLIAKKASVNHSSIGDYYMTIKNELTLDVNQIGNFYCYGNPSKKNINKSKSSTGEVYFFDE